MKTQNNPPDGLAASSAELLALPWVLAEPEPVSPVPEPSPARQLPAARPAERGEAERSERWFKFFVVCTAVWFIVTTVLTVTGAIFPIVGNVLAYLVMMAGLFCWAFLALAFPRSDDDPDAAWGSELSPTAAQCTPSRQTLTGR